MTLWNNLFILDIEKFNSFLEKEEINIKSIDISLFKKGYLPLWENCPDSGYLFHRFNEGEEKDINYQWEKILFALIGEQFNEANILGSVFGIATFAKNSLNYQL